MLIIGGQNCHCEPTLQRSRTRLPTILIFQPLASGSCNSARGWGEDNGGGGRGCISGKWGRKGPGKWGEVAI